MINLIGTEFRDLSNGSTYGYRIYDNYGQDYYNLLNEPIEDDMELLKLALIASAEFFFQFTMGNNGRFVEININNTIYKYEDIKDYL